MSTSPLTISPLLDVNLRSGALFGETKKEKGPPDRRLLAWAREVMKFGQAIFVNGLFRKLQVSTPVVLCFIQCSFRLKLEQKLENTLRALKLFSFTYISCLITDSGRKLRHNWKHNFKFMCKMNLKTLFNQRLIDCVYQFVLLLHCLWLTPLEGYITDPNDYVSKLMVSNVVQLPY